VLTAPPQKLQLMLIEGAIRFGLQARSLWNEDRGAEACEALVRSQEIVVELMNVARQSGHELGRPDRSAFKCVGWAGR
jgi:flagellar protein FliS